MMAMSVIRGTLVTTVRPGASSAAAMSLSAEFFAPTTETSPSRRAPPTTRIRSTPAIVGAVRRCGSPGGGVRGVPALRTLVAMAVHLTRIYTKTGDDGSTGLGDFSRVPKTHPRIGAYADVEECNAALGVALALGQLPDDLRRVLTVVQNDLFDVGADLCNPIVPNPSYPPLRIAEEYITRLEGWCDEYNARLSKLDSFILPGGTPGAALLHVARVVCRRAERSAWALAEVDPHGTNPVALTYLNRLSDLLFILSRVANPGGDVLWKPGGDR